MARVSRPAPKICERCESFFPNIASSTCPQCFAPLVTLTDAQAQRVREFEAQRALDPEYQAQKSTEDEQFKEQSFGACLGVLFVLGLAAVLSIVIFSAAMHHYRKAALWSPAPVISQPQADAALFPPTLAGGQRGMILSDTLLPGTHVPVSWAVYTNGVQVYSYASAGVTPAQESEIEQAVDASAAQHVPKLVTQGLTTARSRFILLAPSEPILGQAMLEMQKTGQ